MFKLIFIVVVLIGMVIGMAINIIDIRTNKEVIKTNNEVSEAIKLSDAKFTIYSDQLKESTEVYKEVLEVTALHNEIIKEHTKLINKTI